MGKHRHKKSFYDVDEDELESFRKHHHHHRRHRRHHSNDQSHEPKQRVPSISSFHPSKLDEDDVALSSPPLKRQRSSSLTKSKPLKLMNTQPIIRNTRQTSLSIVRTISDDKSNEERKWNLKMIASSSSTTISSKQPKKKLTQTVDPIHRESAFHFALIVFRNPWRQLY